MPLDIRRTNFVNRESWTSSDSLSERVYTPRNHAPFRAYPQGVPFTNSAEFATGRLIGRSVWNNKWKLIIPGNTLHRDVDERLKIFMQSVRDIHFFLETYSYTGN